MPQMGYDMQEGTVVRWMKSEGDEVKRGEVIAEIETDKAVVEMEAYDSGVLRKILVAEGTTVPVGQLIGIIGTPDEPLPDLEAAVAAPAPSAEALPKAPAKTSLEPPPQTLAEAPAVDKPPAMVKASPVARRLADEKTLDIKLIPGTGPRGRITKDDVLAYEVRSTEKTPAPPTEAVPSKEEPSETLPLTRMRQAIASLTSRSKAEIPHFYVAADVDMTEAMRVRQQVNDALESEGIRVSVNDMIVKASAAALKNYPSFNAAYQGDHLLLNPSINIGIAIAMEKGLIVSAIMDCGGKTLGEIAKASKDLVDRAQKGVLHPDEYTKSTFSISNLGMFDVDSFVAIIHPPNAAVLAVGTIRQQPVVRDGEVTVAQVMKATLSVDHRVADGAQGAQFLGEIKRLLENPASLVM